MKTNQHQQCFLNVPFSICLLSDPHSHGFAPPSGVLLAAQATATEDSQRALSESL